MRWVHSKIGLKLHRVSIQGLSASLSRFSHCYTVDTTKTGISLFLVWSRTQYFFAIADSQSFVVEQCSGSKFGESCDKNYIVNSNLASVRFGRVSVLRYEVLPVFWFRPVLVISIWNPREILGHIVTLDCVISTRICLVYLRSGSSKPFLSFGV